MHWKSSFRLSRISLERSVGLEKPPRECLATCQRENTNELPGNEATLIVNVNQLMKDAIAHAAASHNPQTSGQKENVSFYCTNKNTAYFNTVYRKLCCKTCVAVINVTLILCREPKDLLLPLGIWKMFLQSIHRVLSNHLIPLFIIHCCSWFKSILLSY